MTNKEKFLLLVTDDVSETTLERAKARKKLRATLISAGGKREGAGRKSQWVTEDKSVRVTIQIPAGKAEEIKAKIEKILKPLRKKTV